MEVYTELICSGKGQVLAGICECGNELYMFHIRALGDFAFFSKPKPRNAH
jgi:hypothetical protein